VAGVIRARLTSPLPEVSAEPAVEVSDFALCQRLTRQRGTTHRVAHVRHPLHRVIIALQAVSESAALQAEYPLPHPSPAAIFKELDEGGVLLSTTDEVYFGVNPVGAKIWSLLPPVSRTFGELCAALERQYPDAGADRIRVDVQEFLEALIASGLVVAAST
jgi:hypothetical protein